MHQDNEINAVKLTYFEEEEAFYDRRSLEGKQNIFPSHSRLIQNMHD